MDPGSMLAAAQATNKRGYAAGNYGIELDGIIAGWVSSVEGGHASSDLVSEKTGAQQLQQKHIAAMKYEDITLNCGTGMSKAFYEWIKAAFDGQYARKNGAVIACDYDFKELSRMEFTGALITEVGLPALDAASKDAAKMSIKITPEYTHISSTPGAGKATAAPAPKAMQKKWLPSNFRLGINGLDCTRVNKIEALTLKQKVVENPVGEIRSYQKGPANREISNLVITLPESDVAGWEAWHKSFVISGKAGQGNARNGQLEYLTPDLRETLFTLTFHNLGLFKLTPEKVEAGSENIRRVKAEMYCEDIKFEHKSSAWA